MSVGEGRGAFYVKRDPRGCVKNVAISWFGIMVTDQLCVREPCEMDHNTEHGGGRRGAKEAGELFPNDTL